MLSTPALAATAAYPLDTLVETYLAGFWAGEVCVSATSIGTKPMRLLVDVLCILLYNYCNSYSDYRKHYATATGRAVHLQESAMSVCSGRVAER